MNNLINALFSKNLTMMVNVLKDIFNSFEELFVLMEVHENSFRYVTANNSAMKVLNLGEEVFGKTLEESRSPEVASFLRPKYEQVLKTNETLIFEEEFHLMDNDKMIGETSLTPLFHEETKYILAIIRDVTDRKNREEELEFIEKKLKLSEKRFRNLIELSPESVVVQRNETIIYVNPAGVRLLGGQHLNDVVGKSVWEFIHHDSREFVKERVDLLSGTNFEDKIMEPAEVKITRLDGKIVYVEETSVLTEYNYLPAIQIVLRDITERKQYEEQLEFLAYHDPLTGLVNRRMFTELVNQSITEAKRVEGKLAVLYLDMDNFKDVNDTLGHEIGDELLKQFSKRLKESVRESDVLCRVGGDEFLVLLKNVENKSDVIEFAERIYHAFQEPYSIKDHKIAATSSIGISVYPHDGTNYKTLLRNADQALYLAKEMRNKYKFYH